jgi:non-specific serine/threonine protein kinase
MTTASDEKAPAPPLQYGLPVPLTTFIGRDTELVRLQQLLDPLTSRPRSTRLLTLVGAGGCGKTRLAIELARRVTENLPDGVRFVDLSPIADAAIVPSTVLTSLGGRDSSDLAPLEGLLRRVQGRKLLLVLDNCEHLVGACAELVDTLLGATSELRVLATSREALRVSGEVAWRVPSLEVPDLDSQIGADHLLEFAAVRLFLDRVFQVDTDFSPTDANALAVAQICSRLDGIPLAIELAAARASGMSVHEIATRLDDCFHLLTGGSRTALERHRTLRATIDWSHALLTDTEQTLFRRLAMFAGGWTLEAAEAVCEGEPLGRSDILDNLMRLIDQSLVSTRTQDGHTRYRFLETVRVYAAEQLRAAGESSTIEARHRAWCLSFAEGAAEGLRGPDQFTWGSLVRAEQDNVRNALDSCGEDPSTAEIELRLAAAMALNWMPSKPVEGRRRLAHALDRAPAMPSAARATALTSQAFFERNFGDPVLGRELASRGVADARAIGDVRQTIRALRMVAWLIDDEHAPTRFAALEEALVLARGADDKGQMAELLSLLGAANAEAGNLEQARVLLEEGDVLARNARNPWSQRGIQHQLGWLAIAEGRPEAAESHFRVGLSPATRMGNAPLPITLLALCQVRLMLDDLEQARALSRQALVQVRETEPGGMIMADALVEMACVEAASGRHDRAQRLLGANEAWYAAHGGAGRVWRHSTQNPLKRGHVPIPPMPTDPILVQERAQGRVMSLDEAVAFALEPADSSPSQVSAARPAPSPSARAYESKAATLTAREREIANLMAVGRSNREIAAQLVITEGTVEVHVKHILGKLGLRSRAQVAGWFAHQGPA